MALSESKQAELDAELARLDAGGAPPSPLYACGSDAEGRLGLLLHADPDGRALLSVSPVPVALPDGFALGAFAGGGRHSLVADSVRGTLYGVGDNSDGQLGRPRGKLRGAAELVEVLKGADGHGRPATHFRTPTMILGHFKNCIFLRKKLQQVSEFIQDKTLDRRPPRPPHTRRPWSAHFCSSRYLL